jgi:hypothetical protein
MTGTSSLAPSVSKVTTAPERGSRKREKRIDVEPTTDLMV